MIHGCLECSRGRPLQRHPAEFFGQNLDPPRSCISRFPNALREAFHVKLALTAEPAVVDGVLVKAPRRLECPVVQFNAHDPLQGHLLHFFVRNVQLDH